MRRWNGWGDATTVVELPAQGASFLVQRVGEGCALPDASLDTALARVPASRLPAHALYSIDAHERLLHARGQSLPDWLALREGTLGVYPDAVAFPETAADIRQLLKLAEEQDVCLIPYGGGTSVAGHINPPTSARPVLTVSLARMNRLTDLDEQSLLATFGPGASGPQVESQLRARGYTLGHFPQSWELSTLGGWVASRSSGQQSLRYGRIEQLFAGGTLETFAGPLQISTFPASAAGPDLREIVLGCEGRFGIISEVKVRVSALPADERFYGVFLPDWAQALCAIRQLAQARVPLSMLRLSNAVETETQLALAGHPQQIAWLEKYLSLRGAGVGKCLLTFGVTGNRQQNALSLRQARQHLKAFGGVFTGTLLGKKWAQNRFRFPYLRENLWNAGYVVDTLETATDWSNVDHLLNLIESSLRDALAAEGERVHVFTHLSHVYGEGSSIYTTYVFRPAADYPATLARWQALKHAASQTIVTHHGTISHQHGVGKDHAAYLLREKGALAVETLQALSRHFDPAGRLNPGTLLAE
ncbi:FAD-binding oxidoreductase [Pseudomonas granadensis]|uniref:FAD-binding oxidoreductase n=1 Tax=Pseudomonas granadensis TaxID=1421430 RepID=UPI0019D0F00A|nr:FAD-binding oxidoreductase [Pseudomonas granadensis]MBN6774511.1 FAD-binding oxidoreductase [Pseudomonas granadensis]MBN6805689.1 FAD-binding oxidoreductase [Pseudomonas granadensis]MBN6832537.1 FAD-binding oxidoreductase [Pseudomonas granadensis]MBN6839883.1 FAD-binding oxidoreductase [Pseudomonas granadensis]MBN6869258.1 FAD-binding oxidoreductase [Pseudomonas granadensis]